MLALFNVEGKELFLQYGVKVQGIPYRVKVSRRNHPIIRIVTVIEWPLARFVFALALCRYKARYDIIMYLGNQGFSND